MWCTHNNNHIPKPKAKAKSKTKTKPRTKHLPRKQPRTPDAHVNFSRDYKLLATLFIAQASLSFKASSNINLVVSFKRSSSLSMTCIINSTQSLVLATAMVVSSTVLFLAFSKQKNDSKEPQEETLRSCLYSGMIRRAGFESQDFFIRRIFLSQRKSYDHSFNFCTVVL